MTDLRDHPQPRTGQRYPAAIVAAGWHLWDNFGYLEAGVTHIYAQAADRIGGEGLEARYWRAYWRHFSSRDDGRTWMDEGPTIVPRTGSGTYDSKAIWSGSVISREDGAKIAAYTGLAEGRLALQSIALALSDDGYRFRRANDQRPLLSARDDYDRLVSRGYYLGPLESIGDEAAESDGTFLALRDPFLFEHDDGALHMLFGAKAIAGGQIVRAVGHAIVVDPFGAPACELLPPILVPDGGRFNQLELPNLVRHDGLYYLVISTTHLSHLGQSDLHAEKAVRIYRSAALDTGWEPYGSEGGHVILAPESRLYGLSMLADRHNDGPSLACRAFWVDDTSLPPSLTLVVGEEVPSLDRDPALWGTGPHR